MILSDFHTHTCYCDGTNTPEEMVIAALEKGMPELGLLTHSYTFYDESYCIKQKNILKFVEEVNSLKKKHEGKIKIFCGVEQDYYSDSPTDMFDYVIGSVHYLKCANKYFPLDSEPKQFADMVRDFYGGDFYLMAEDYFNIASDVAEKTGANIIGHFDIITKFNEQHDFFDMKNERYLVAAKKAVDRLIPYDIPFEINTGAIARSIRTAPYPSAEIIEYIRQNGGKFILSSDAHSASNLCFKFNEFESLINSK